MAEALLRTITNYVVASEEDYLKLKELGSLFNSSKNYFYSRFSGVKTMKNLNFIEIKKSIYNGQEDLFHKQFKGNRWQLCLRHTLGNIKTSWKNNLREAKKKVQRNENLTKQEKHFLNIILSSTWLTGVVIEGQFKKSMILELDRFENYRETYKKPIDLEFKKLFNKLKRYVRETKSKIPYTNNDSIYIFDTMLMSQKQEDNQTINISSLEKNNFIRLKTHKKQNMNITSQIILDFSNKLIKVNHTKSVKVKKEKRRGYLGADKGYKTLLNMSNKKTHGNNYSKKIGPLVEERSNKLKRRQYYWDLYFKAIEKENYSLAEKIQANNLGHKVWNHHTKKIQEYKKSLMNNSINEMIRNEKVKNLVVEDLSFTSKKKNRNKKIQNELSQWDKGFIQNRLEFKTYEHNMNIVEVNAAYTSQVCHKCGHFGDRNYSNFKCLNEKCQWQGNADYNAACVIEARRKDNEINLSLTPQQVKSILLKRIKN